MSKEYKARWFQEHYVPRPRLPRSINPCTAEGCTGTYAWSQFRLCNAYQRRTDYTRHRERHRRSGREWAKRNRPTKNAYQNQRRAVGGTFMATAWEALVAAFGHLCAYCRRRFDRLEHDHIVPLSRGGLNVAGNIIPACRSCNAAKGAR